MKNVLITGATRGLGAALTSNCLKSGFRVIATGRTKSEHICLLEEEFGFDRIRYHSLDLSEHGKHQEFIRSLTKEYGPLYGLINNAAIGRDGVLGTMYDKEVEEVIWINLTSTILLTKYAVRSMLLTRIGRVINISSIIANTGFSGLSVYAASKAGLIGFTKSLARELGKANVTVNAICPGYMTTDMSQSIQEGNLAKIIRRSPLGKLITPEEVAIHTIQLLAPSAQSITGSVFTLDAGSTA